MTKGDFEGRAEAQPPQSPEDESALVEEEASEDASLETPEPSVEQQLAERTADLQRLQAEYVNYRKRVERDRALARTAGEASVLRSLLTVLDDIGRAEKHGELEGGFKAVADALHQAVKAHRLEAFGAPGEAFDPKLHEALFHAGESADAEVTTIDSVVRTGYRIDDVVIRHAQVGVVDPESSEAGDEPADSDSANDEPPAAEANELPAGEADE
ncbi:MAG TPA: nucleotide exchange factor GrpE [Aeromicrobium sp.]|nr:nucleotide exchange factor GrpE [Aeromicrobium sp.]